MNNNVLLWIEALRSGDYEQGYGHLNKGNKLCCLGVACEIYQKKVGGLDLYISYEIDVPIKNYDGRSLCLPVVVQEWLGLSHDNGLFKDGTLAFLNDHRISFEEIADVIESCPAGLFKEPAQ